MLKITYSQYIACKRGYNTLSKDQEALAVKTGYYAAYFNNTKNASLQRILNNIYAIKQKHVDTIDVEKFKEQERNFKERYAKWQMTQKRK